MLFYYQPERMFFKSSRCSLTKARSMAFTNCQMLSLASDSNSITSWTSATTPTPSSTASTPTPTTTPSAVAQSWWKRRLNCNGYKTPSMRFADVMQENNYIKIQSRDFCFSLVRISSARKPSNPGTRRIVLKKVLEWCYIEGNIVYLRSIKCAKSDGTKLVSLF